MHEDILSTRPLQICVAYTRVYVCTHALHHNARHERTGVFFFCMRVVYQRRCTISVQDAWENSHFNMGMRKILAVLKYTIETSGRSEPEFFACMHVLITIFGH
jgi:hypothetical protein